MIRSLDKIYVVGHKKPDTDTIISALAYANLLSLTYPNKKIKAMRTGSVNDETKWVLKQCGLNEPEMLNDAIGKNIILVDHNELEQAPDNIREANIIEIVDHHKIGNIETVQPISFANKIRGSTSTIIAERYFKWKIKPNKKIAKAMLFAILSDTMILKSPTTTDHDKKMVRKLKKVADVSDYKKEGLEMLGHGSLINTGTANHIVTVDSKEFVVKGGKVLVGQTNVVDFKGAEYRYHELFEEMEYIRKKKEYLSVCLMVVHIIKLDTELLIVGDVDKLERSFERKTKNGVIYLKGIVSRKKQIMPKIMEAYK